MRLPTSAHTSRPWRIHEIAPDFAVEDVWALPATGGPDDFAALLDVATTLDFPDSAPLPVRVVWTARDELGRWLGLGRISVPPDEASGPLPIPGAPGAPGAPGDDAEGADAVETSLVERLPDDLRGTTPRTITPGTPLRPVYRTDDEYAEELSNRTVHSVMHLGWVEQPDGTYRGQMAVLVKPRGLLGTAYMALIKPFRYALVYPALLRAVDRAWRRRPTPAASPSAAQGAGRGDSCDRDALVEGRPSITHR